MSKLKMLNFNSKIIFKMSELCSYCNNHVYTCVRIVKEEFLMIIYIFLQITITFKVKFLNLTQNLNLFIL